MPTIRSSSAENAAETCSGVFSAGGLLVVIVAVRRRRLGATVGRTARLVRTGGANVADIERGTENNRFAYAPAIAAGALAAALGL